MCDGVQLGKPSHSVVRRSSMLIGRCAACLAQARLRTGGCHGRACGCARVSFQCAAAVAAAGRACSHISFTAFLISSELLRWMRQRRNQLLCGVPRDVKAHLRMRHRGFHSASPKCAWLSLPALAPALPLRVRLLDLAVHRQAVARLMEAPHAQLRSALECVVPHAAVRLHLPLHCASRVACRAAGRAWAAGS